MSGQDGLPQGGGGEERTQATSTLAPRQVPLPVVPKSEGTARCYRCGPKLLAEFARDRSKASGYKSICKSCDAAKAGDYYAANGERVRARINSRNAELRHEGGGS